MGFFRARSVTVQGEMFECEVDKVNLNYQLHWTETMPGVSKAQFWMSVRAAGNISRVG